MKTDRLNPKACAAAAFLLAVFAAAAQAQEPDGVGLPNFQRVSDHIYRGGQPTPEGLRLLAALGFKTVLNLRADDERAQAEERLARAAGLRYFNVPLPVYARPRDEQIERALAVVLKEENWPVFVHCKRGADRTGTVVAAYRISRDGWTGEEALREAARHGLSRAQVEMRDYVADYHRRRAGLTGRGRLGTNLPAAASEATRRTLAKSYALTRERLRHLKHVFR